MKKAENQIPSKANFSTFLQLNCSKCKLKPCERPYSYQTSLRDKVWVELEDKYFFQRQSCTNYLRLTLVLIQNYAVLEKFNLCF